MPDTVATTVSGMSRHLLIPVDFSESSLLAIYAGFRFAMSLNAVPVILHAYPAVPVTDLESAQYFDPIADNAMEEMRMAIENRDLRHGAELGLKALKKRISSAMDSGRLPDVRYVTLLQEGTAEDVILEYCKENAPRIVVMSTRGANRKKEDLIGSVTAEVLDSCRVPVFTVPANYSGKGNGPISRVLMFCTLDQYDINTLESLMATFEKRDMEIWLMPVSRHKVENALSKLKSLFLELSEKWPEVRFHIADVEQEGISLQLDTFLQKNGIELLIAPNRKKGLLTNLFRPSVAHKCLFTIDLPMLALPAANNLFQKQVNK